MSRFAITGADIVLPDSIATSHAVLVEGGITLGVVPVTDVERGLEVIGLDGGTLWPGFVDIQVNGGGGVLFNDSPSVEAIATIAQAHRRYGTTSFLPTLISDTPDVIASAIEAASAAVEAGVPGVLGIHLEGPFLNAARKGVHEERHFAILDAAAIDLLSSMTRGVTLVTLAPERAPPGAIAELVRRGVIVAAGHTEATFEQVLAAADEGMTGLTHLFNAMSPLQSRAPGAVGAAFADPRLRAGLICDGAHVHPGAMRAALAAMGPDRLMLVTDAMPALGGPSDRFHLGGIEVMARGETCWTPDGVLAGSNLSMAGAVANAMTMMGASKVEAARMAGATPAGFLGMSHLRGAIKTGQVADFVHLTASGEVACVWQAGRQTTFMCA